MLSLRPQHQLAVTGYAGYRHACGVTKIARIARGGFSVSPEVDR
jgi:hypothetical protein